MTDLRVGSFNVRNGRAFDGRNSWPFRRRATAEAIGTCDADLMGLQEVFAFQLSWLSKQLKPYSFHGAARSGHSWGERNPIAVRRQIGRIVDCETRWYGPTPTTGGSRLPNAKFPRVATMCTLELTDVGRRVRFVNTHFDAANESNRVMSADQLVSWIDPELPCVIVGDLNSEPGSTPVRSLEAAGFRQALDADAGGTDHGFTGRIDGARLDHILISEQFEVLRAGVVRVTPNDRLPSDHWPVVAQLRIN